METITDTALKKISIQLVNIGIIKLSLKQKLMLKPKEFKHLVGSYRLPWFKVAQELESQGAIQIHGTRSIVICLRPDLLMSAYNSLLQNNKPSGVVLPTGRTIRKKVSANIRTHI